MDLNKRNWGIPQLYQEIVDQWGTQAMPYSTLWRGLTGKTTLRRDKHIYIASALGTTPQGLRKGTNEEDKRSRFTYNDRAYLEYEASPLPYLTAEFHLLSKAKTEPESDPPEKGHISAVIKTKFTEADTNGSRILDELIQQGILRENSSGRIYLIRREGQFITRPAQLAGENFNEIWGILSQPTFTKWLHALFGETTCVVQSPNGIQELVVKAGAEGTVNKSKFNKAAPDGAKLVEDLVKRGILEESIDPKKVRLKRGNSEYVNRPYELTGKKFDAIWMSLQQFSSVYFDSTMLHHFENRSNKKTICILIKNPKYT